MECPRPGSWWSGGGWGSGSRAAEAKRLLATSDRAPAATDRAWPGRRLPGVLPGLPPEFCARVAEQPMDRSGGYGPPPPGRGPHKEPGRHGALACLFHVPSGSTLDFVTMTGVYLHFVL